MEPDSIHLPDGAAEPLTQLPFSTLSARGWRIGSFGRIALTQFGCRFPRVDSQWLVEPGENLDRIKIGRWLAIGACGFSPGTPYRTAFVACDKRRKCSASAGMSTPITQDGHVDSHHVKAIKQVFPK